MKIQFKTKENPEVRTVEYNFGEDAEGNVSLDALVAKFGAESVAASALGAYIISIQALGRRFIEKPDAELQEIDNGWNPNERASVAKLTPMEKIQRALGSLSQEDRDALLAKLTG